MTFYLIWYFILQFSLWVIFIFFIKHSTEALELWERQDFFNILKIYGIVFMIAISILFITHKGWIYSYNRYIEFMESKYLPEYIRFDMNSYEKIGTGKSIAIISKGFKMWWWLIDRFLIEIIGLLLSLAVTFYLLLQINEVLVFILIALLFLWLNIWLYLNNKAAKIRLKRIELDNIWSKRMVKIIMAKAEILQSSKIEKEISKIHKLHEWQIYYNGKMAIYLVPFFIIWSLIIMILLFIVFIYFWDLYLEWKIWLALITSLTGSLLMMQTVFLNFLDFLKTFWKDFSEVEVLWDFLDTTPQIQWFEEWNTFQHKNWKIELKNISYWYDESKPVFKKLSLEIPGSKVTALVWPSGGGKSTLVKLIAWYIRQDSGDILVDEQNLQEVSLKSYYKDIWYLTQEPSVFDGTIRDNLLYAVTEDINQYEINNIIQQAHCEFIYDLPLGLDTEIGERWVKLSWGQKQRLAIAKIFLKNPKIIILDEPTSALDSLSEQKITQAMHNLFKDRTVLVIAHRLQTVKHADDIIVIENWQVKEQGTHKELVKLKWFYKQMLDLQSGF